MFDNNAAHIETAIGQNKNVAVGSWGDASRRSALLVGNHVYTVVRIERDAWGARSVVLRNPYGYDISGPGPTSGDPNDGIITLSEAEFRRSMFGYTIT